MDLSGSAAERPRGLGDPPPLRCTVCRDLRVVHSPDDYRAGSFDRLRPCPACTEGEGPPDDPQRRYRGAGPGLDYDWLARFRFGDFRTSHTDGPLAENLAGAVRVAREWARGERPWLLLASDAPGCGKTHLAAAALQEWIARGGDGAFADVPALVDGLRREGDAASGARTLRDDLAAAGALVLDDLGGEYRSAWSANQIELLLAARRRRGRSTLLVLRSGSVETNDDAAVRWRRQPVLRAAEWDGTICYTIEAGDWRLRPQPALRD